MLTPIVGDPLFGEPIIVALFLEVKIREQEFDSVIHTYPSKLLDQGSYCPAFVKEVVKEGVDQGQTVSFKLKQS